MPAEAYGELAGLVKTSGCIIASVSAIGFAWRGRSKWEPAEQDVSSGPQKVAGVLATALVIYLWTTFSTSNDVPNLVKTALIAGFSCMLALMVYTFIVAANVYVGKPRATGASKPTKIIGGFWVLGRVKRRLSTDDQCTIQSILDSAKGDPDAVWARSSRAFSKVIFTLAYSVLTICGTCAVSASAQGLLLKTNSKSIVVPVDKKVVHVAIVLNGSIFYTRQIMGSFVLEAERLAKTSPYTFHFEWAVGEPSVKNAGRNKSVFEEVLRRFPTRHPDYLVTIGTLVSKYGYENYRGKIPLIFLGVTDPVRLGLVSSLAPDSSRGNVAGVLYGIDGDAYRRFFNSVFPGKRLCYIWSDEYPQDKQFLAQMNSMCDEKEKVPSIELKEPRLTAEQAASADIFFGRFFVTQRLDELISSNPNVPFVAGDRSNLYRGAVASISADNDEAGRIAATELLWKNLNDGKALAEMPVVGPRDQITGINVAAARHYGLSISQEALDHATERI